MTQVVKEAIEIILSSHEYNQNKVTPLTNSIVESCLASLTKMQKPFKYIGEFVTSSVKEK